MEEETLKEDKIGNWVTLRWGENTKYKEEDKNKETLRERKRTWEKGKGMRED